jgi:hypothetical protein
MEHLTRSTLAPYIEPPYDDTTCFSCGQYLPAEPVEGTPEFNGFCSRQCQAALRAVRPQIKAKSSEKLDAAL